MPVQNCTLSIQAPVTVMTLPTTYLSALIVALAGLVCLGSWINTLKLAGKWRYELYYYDFAIGAMVLSVAAALTLGTLGADGFVFMDDLMRAGRRHMAAGAAAGVVFNLGNMLLVASTTLIGMVLAFPIGMSIALLVASIIGYLAEPQGNRTLLSVALFFLLAGLVFGVLAHRSLSLAREIQKMKAGEHRTLSPRIAWKGVILAVIAGVPLGAFNPLTRYASAGDAGIGPYSLLVMFCGGVAFSTFVFNLYLMNLPVEGRPIEILEYFRGSKSSHLWGWLGGATWAAGMLAFLVAGGATEETQLADNLRFVLMQAAPLLAALWGLAAWREFRGGDVRSYTFAFLMLLFIAGTLVLLWLAGFSAF